MTRFVRNDRVEWRDDFRRMSQRGIVTKTTRWHIFVSWDGGTAFSRLRKGVHKLRRCTLREVSR